MGELIAVARDPTVGLIAHEAVHVVQQRQGRNKDGGSAEAEAVTLGMRAAAGQSISASLGEPAVASKHGGVSTGVQRAPNQPGTTDPSYILGWLAAHESGKAPSRVLEELSDAHGSNENRYFFTRVYGWVDVRHFGAAASWACWVGSVSTEAMGFVNEVVQWGSEWGNSYRSGFSVEDIPSNAAGAEFGDDYVNAIEGESISGALQRWMRDNGALPDDHPEAGREALPVQDPAQHGGVGRRSNASTRRRTSSSPSSGSSSGSTSGSYGSPEPGAGVP